MRPEESFWQSPLQRAILAHSMTDSDEPAFQASVRRPWARALAYTF